MAKEVCCQHSTIISALEFERRFLREQIQRLRWIWLFVNHRRHHCHLHCSVGLHDGKQDSSNKHHHRAGTNGAAHAICTTNANNATDAADTADANNAPGTAHANSAPDAANANSAADAANANSAADPATANTA